MERVPDETGAVSWHCSNNTQETPSESSEAESSEASTADEDEEEGWESGQFSRHFDLLITKQV